MFLKSSNRIYKAFGVQRWKAFVSWLAPLAPFVIVSASLRRLTGVYSATPDGGVPLDTAFDPSLAQGGLLWFTDLTAADPYYVLPIMSSVAIATNLWLNMPADRLRTLLTLDSQQGGGASDSRLARALGRLSLAMPLLPLLMSYLPSAIILYWVTNFSLTIVNDVVVRRLVPDKPPRVEQFKGDDDFKNRVMPYLPAAYPPAAEGSGKVAVDSEATKKS